MSQINVRFDRHDYEQLLLLARLKHTPVTELIRSICKAHLDGVDHGRTEKTARAG
ncbi:MAG TPA: hypothetical protein VK660_07220 [Xanthomonadaceae bacterium]|jgi:hypothetical protein|nr:hypothetical protein [Xanthomonadaceae bacterium]